VSTKLISEALTPPHRHYRNPWNDRAPHRAVGGFRVLVAAARPARLLDHVARPLDHCGTLWI